MEGKFYSGPTRNVHPWPRVGAIRRRERSTGGPRPGLQVTEGAREPRGTDAAREALRPDAAGPAANPGPGVREDQSRIQLKGCGPGADVKSCRPSLSPGTGRHLGCTLPPCKWSRPVPVPALSEGLGALPGNPDNATRGESSLRQKMFAFGQFKLSFRRAAAYIRATISPVGGKKPEELYLIFFCQG